MDEYLMDDAIFVAVIQNSDDIVGYWLEIPTAKEVIVRFAHSNGIPEEKVNEEFCRGEWTFDVKAMYPMINSDHIYDPKFGDNKFCECGHPYERHFDSCERMEPVGCKYCECYEFKSNEKFI